MLYKQKIIALTMLFIILASNSFTVLGVSTINSGDFSGEGPAILPPTGPISSGEPSSENILSSTAKSSSISTNKNTTITSTMRAELSSGETNIKYVIETNPTHGTLLYEDNTVATFTYTPDKNYTGTDTFSFKLTNGIAFSNTAMVTITITENSEPVIPFHYVDMQDHWANYSASHLAARSLIIGEEIGNRYYFKPNTLTTRSDMMLYLLAITESNGDASLEIPKITFADETLYPDWLLEAAKLAYAKGIIKGSSSGNKLYLNLYDNLTRVQACIMVNNIIKGKTTTETLTYADKDQIPSWGLEAVKSLTAYKIVQGDGSHFRPNSNITKAETIEICYKLLKQLELDNWENNSGDIK